MGRYYVFGRAYPTQSEAIRTRIELGQNVRPDSVWLGHYSREQLAQLQIEGHPIKYNHLHSERSQHGVIGRILHHTVAPDGSLFITSYLSTDRHQSPTNRTLACFVRDELKAGRTCGLSIAFREQPYGTEQRGITHTEKSPLEISLVDTPAYSTCRIVAHGTGEQLGEDFVRQLGGGADATTDRDVVLGAQQAVQRSEQFQVSWQQLENKIKILQSINRDTEKQFIDSDPLNRPTQTVQNILREQGRLPQPPPLSAMSTETVTASTPAAATETPVAEPEKRERERDTPAQAAAAATGAPADANKIQKTGDPLMDQALEELGSGYEHLSKDQIAAMVTRFMKQRAEELPHINRVKELQNTEQKERLERVQNLEKQVMPIMTSDAQKRHAEEHYAHLRELAVNNPAAADRELSMQAQVMAFSAEKAREAHQAQQRAEQLQQKYESVQRESQFLGGMNQVRSTLADSTRTYNSSSHAFSAPALAASVSHAPPPPQEMVTKSVSSTTTMSSSLPDSFFDQIFDGASRVHRPNMGKIF